MFNTLNEAQAWVQSQIKFRPKVSLDHMKNAFKMLSLDMSKIKKIHITGTNGKGSVSMFVSHILKSYGLKVGTFTSPYLLKFNERIKVNVENISDIDFLKVLNKMYELNDKMDKMYQERLSFFELLTLAAFDHFVEEAVDVMVIEVGIGGLLDATNIIDYDVSAITNIGLEHTKTLGDTLESVLYNKLGIVKKNHHLITTLDGLYSNQIEQHCFKNEATYQLIQKHEISSLCDQPNRFQYQGDTFQLSLLGPHQQFNAVLSLEIVKYIYPQIPNETVKEGLLKTKHEGRLEKVLDGVFVDGAHNEHAVNALIRALQTTFKGYRIHVLFSALQDKTPAKLLQMIKPHVSTLITTSFPDPRYESLESLPFKFILDPYLALVTLLKSKKDTDLIIITGSLHFVGFMKEEIIPLILEKGMK